MSENTKPYTTETSPVTDTTMGLSRPRHEITCPECGNHDRFTVDTHTIADVVLSGEGPDNIETTVDGEFYAFSGDSEMRCSQCDLVGPASIFGTQGSDPGRHYRVTHHPTAGGPAYSVEVRDMDTAIALFDALGEYDAFLRSHGLIGDLSNMAYIEHRASTLREWEELEIVR